MTNTEDTKILAGLRKDMFLAAYTGGQAHLASAFSCAELLYALYGKGIAHIDPDRPDDPDRDRLILSKGHAGLALYALLAYTGFISREELYSFIQPGSRMGGEPCLSGIPGVEAATGSLGHGLSIGLGMALAGKLDHKPYHVYVILGDGECQEGTIWEAVMAARRYELDNMTALLDANRIQKMGLLADTMKIEEWRSKWESFGWCVDEITDGHDVEEICSVLGRKGEKDRPRLVIAHTVKGKGVSIMENNSAWHFKMPSRRELKKFMEELAITQEELDQCKKLI